MKVKELKEKVLNGKLIGKEEALFLAKEAPLKELTEAANEIRKHFCEDKFDICTIIMEKAESVVKTASSVLNLLFMIHILKNIHY